MYKCCARIVSDDRCEDCMLNLHCTPFSAMCFCCSWKIDDDFMKPRIDLWSTKYAYVLPCIKLFFFIACYFQIIEMQYRMFFRMIILMLNTFETNHEVFCNSKTLNYQWNDYQYHELVYYINLKWSVNSWYVRIYDRRIVIKSCEFLNNFESEIFLEKWYQATSNYKCSKTWNINMSQYSTLWRQQLS